MSAFSTAYKITYTQGCACLYSQHLVGWCKISSSQTKPTTNTTKYPKCVTASLTSSDSKEIRILWNNQALCILKVPCLPMSPTKAWKCIVLGTQLSGRILTQFVQDSVHSAERREKHQFFSSRHSTFYSNNCLPQNSVFICFAAGSYFYLNGHLCSFCRDHSLHSEELSSGENSPWALVYRSWLTVKA